jgi:hypothetical protein
MRPDISYETKNRLEKLVNRFSDGEVPSSTEDQLNVLMEFLENRPELGRHPTNEIEVDGINTPEPVPYVDPSPRPTKYRHQKQIADEELFGDMFDDSLF